MWCSVLRSGEEMKNSERVMRCTPACFVLCTLPCNYLVLCSTRSAALLLFCSREDPALHILTIVSCIDHLELTECLNAEHQLMIQSYVLVNRLPDDPDSEDADAALQSLRSLSSRTFKKKIHKDPTDASGWNTSTWTPALQ